MPTSRRPPSVRQQQVQLVLWCVVALACWGALWELTRLGRGPAWAFDVLAVWRYAMPIVVGVCLFVVFLSRESK